MKLKTVFEYALWFVHNSVFRMCCQMLLDETVGREFFHFAQHPPHTRFDAMCGFFDFYLEFLGTLSPCDVVHLPSRSRYVCYPFKTEIYSKFAKCTMNL